ncbi:unnamed protein product [Ranitomeya imitator]|uniref:Protein endoU n=1 Tax=Ranitomeya imitator TaxID=111125 RepID=A0ABN9M079_9NEOB|nr:unnamed protein product [Ranitomeya imitator]
MFLWGSQSVVRRSWGLHNWVQFYLQEKRNNIDYKGFVGRQHKSRPDEDDQVLNLQFSWKDLVKPVGSSFIGSALSLRSPSTPSSSSCPRRRPPKRSSGWKYELQVVVNRHGRYIGTAYPVLLSSNNPDLY